jgi:DNA repair exonuclease SbcCD nuclease subunit
LEIELKIALITDTHAGIRNDNPIFHDYSKKFYDDVFFPHLDSNEIRSVIHLGDIVDRRKYINFNTLNRLKEDFLDPLLGRKMDVHILAGNHDVFYKNTNEINALRELIYGSKYNFNIYDQYATDVTFDGLPILMMPWICDQNRKQIFDSIKSTKAQIAMGHLELIGFQMNKTASVATHGDNPSDFGKFDMVFSGHYHHRSTDGHIFYLGNHAEFDWSDYNDPKGFHIFDTDTRELNFVRNPYSMFIKLFYNDKDKTMNECIMDFDYDSLKNTIVKVVIRNKENPYWFDLFIDKLEKAGVYELQIVEDHLNLTLQDDEKIVDEAEDTLSVFKKFIDGADSSIDKEKLNKIIFELYNEALSTE